MSADLPGTPDPWWKAGAHQAIKARAATGREFTAADLTDDGLPNPGHPNHWGGVFLTARRAGLIVRVGYVPSRRPGRNGGVCAVWKGTATNPGNHDRMNP